VALPLRVRRVAEEQQDALLAETPKALDVRASTQQRILLQLEVAGVEDAAYGRFDRERR